MQTQGNQFSRPFSTGFSPQISSLLSWQDLIPNSWWYCCTLSACWWGGVPVTWGYALRAGTGIGQMPRSVTPGAASRRVGPEKAGYGWIVTKFLIFSSRRLDFFFFYDAIGLCMLKAWTIRIVSIRLGAIELFWRKRMLEHEILHWSLWWRLRGAYHDVFCPIYCRLAIRWQLPYMKDLRIALQNSKRAKNNKRPNRKDVWGFWAWWSQL